MNILIQTRHLEKIENVKEDCFVSPVVITVKKDKSVKSEFDSGNFYDSCKKRRPHMPKMGELLNQKSTKILRVQNEPLLVW